MHYYGCHGKAKACKQRMVCIIGGSFFVSIPTHLNSSDEKLTIGWKVTRAGGLSNCLTKVRESPAVVDEGRLYNAFYPFVCIPVCLSRCDCAVNIIITHGSVGDRPTRVAFTGRYTDHVTWIRLNRWVGTLLRVHKKGDSLGSFATKQRQTARKFKQTTCSKSRPLNQMAHKLSEDLLSIFIELATG